MFKPCRDYKNYEISDTGILRRSGEILQLKQNQTGYFWKMSKKRKATSTKGGFVWKFVDELE
jgi:hypothetical protein